MGDAIYGRLYYAAPPFEEGFVKIRGIRGWSTPPTPPLVLEGELVTSAYIEEWGVHAGHGILGWETPYMDVSTTLHQHSWRSVISVVFSIFRGFREFRG